jgi:hypothetical protein
MIHSVRNLPGVSRNPEHSIMGSAPEGTTLQCVRGACRAPPLGTTSHAVEELDCELIESLECHPASGRCVGIEGLTS